MQVPHEKSIELNETENELFFKRKQWLARALNVSWQGIEECLLNIRKQAFSLKEEVQQINEKENSLELLGLFEQKQRVSLYFVIQNVMMMLAEHLKKIEFMSKNSMFVIALSESVDNRFNTYLHFKAVNITELQKEASDDGIDDEIVSIWINEWQNKHIIIEQCFDNLIKYILENHFIEEYEQDELLVEKVFNILQDYIESIDTFYSKERKAIHQKYAFKNKGNLPEKLETELEIAELTTKLQEDICNILFRRESMEERVFLFKWIQPLIDAKIDNIVEMLDAEVLLADAEMIIKEFNKLRLESLRTFLMDSTIFITQQKQRDSEYNALIYRMRKNI